MTIPTERRGATQHKLEEANFFRAFLKPNYGKEKKFDFYLSAFISAARSVTLIMRAEFEKVPGWEAWFEAEQAKADEPLKKGTTDARNRLLKYEPLRTFGDPIFMDPYTANGDAVDADSFMARIVREHLPTNMGGTTGKFFIEAVVDDRTVRVYFRQVMLHRELKEFPGEHILSVCNRYYEWLAKIVGECEAKFGKIA